MPENISEIVVDKWLIDKFLDRESPFQSMFSNPEDFLGADMLCTVTGERLKIVGISETQEPTVYLSQNKALALSVNGYSIASLKQLQEKYPDKYDDVTLKKGEVLAAKTKYKGYINRGVHDFRMPNDRDYHLAGDFPDDFHVTYVLNEEDCTTIRNDFIKTSGDFQVYVENPKKEIKQLRKITEPYSDKLSLSLSIPSQSQLTKFEKSRKDTVSSRNLIAVAAVVISLFIIYFTIKSNVTSRTEELTVYRLIGIGKGSIIRAYLLEMFLITSYTVLPAVLITSGVIKFIGSIPSLELKMIFPAWCILILLLAMYLLNLLISILPVRNILSQPPAVLAAKK